MKKRNGKKKKIANTRRTIQVTYLFSAIGNTGDIGWDLAERGALCGEALVNLADELLHAALHLVGGVFKLAGDAARGLDGDSGSRHDHVVWQRHREVTLRIEKLRIGRRAGLARARGCHFTKRGIGMMVVVSVRGGRNDISGSPGAARKAWNAAGRRQQQVGHVVHT